MQTADFTIADVLAFARSKPADEEYTYTSAAICALGQYARELCGVSEADAACGLYERRLAPGLKDAANGYGTGGNTFGAFVARLEKLCPQAPVPQSEWAAIDAYLTDIEDVARERVMS